MKTDSPLGVVSYTPGGDPNSIVLSSDLQKTIPSTCSFGSKSPWGMTRTAADKLTADEKTYLTHVGDFYYTRTYPQQGCDEAKDLMQKLDTGYKNMYDSIEKN